MTTSDKNRARPATRGEIIQIAGALDDKAIADIEDTGATRDDVLEAFVRLSQEDDFSALTQKPMRGRVARVYDILVADRLDDEER